MNTLEELQDKHNKSSIEIDRVKREIKEESAKATTARQEIAALKSCIEDLITQSNSALKQARLGRAPVMEIVESQKQLKEKIDQHQAELKGLESKLFSSSALGISGLLQNELSFHNRILNSIRDQIIEIKLQPLAGEITDAVKEPLNKMALFHLSRLENGANKDDIYRSIGVELCKELFGEQNKFKAKLPDVFQAKQQVYELIGMPL